nr:MAG TPA: hypothetical protein [Caudoviricetes sp.]DAY87035.1 MAG TPA: hypothetical protein [Caudoviricetes sp.]
MLTKPWQKSRGFHLIIILNPDVIIALWATLHYSLA